MYEQAGVKEYWIIHPMEETVLPYRLVDKNKYELLRKTPFVKGEKIPVSIFPDFEVDLDDIFIPLQG